LHKTKILLYVDHSSIIQTNNDDSNYGPQKFTKADTAKKTGDSGADHAGTIASSVSHLANWPHLIQPLLSINFVITDIFIMWFDWRSIWFKLWYLKIKTEPCAKVKLFYIK